MGWLLAPLFGKLNGKSRCFILRRGHRYGQVRGTRREPRSAARPSRWRLCVRTHARQCLASNAPSPMGAHGRHPCRPNGPANLPTPLPTEMAGQSLKSQAKAGQHLRRRLVIDADSLSIAAAAIAPLRRPSTVTSRCRVAVADADATTKKATSLPRSPFRLLHLHCRFSVVAGAGFEPATFGL